MQYLYNIGVSLSQLLSVFLGGEPDESVSQRTARAYLSYDRKGWFKFQLEFIDFLVFWEDNHCLNSLHGEKNTKTLWRWEKDK